MASPICKMSAYLGSLLSLLLSKRNLHDAIVPEIIARWSMITLLLLVLCEYSTFRMESNSYFSIRFDLKWFEAQLFEIHKGVQENDVSVKMCMCTLLLLTMVQVLYLLEVFI